MKTEEDLFDELDAQKEKEEKEAEAYLHSLSHNQTDINTVKTTEITPTNEMDGILSENFELIEGCNQILRDRIMNSDESLTLKDLISAKDTAFKQNQLIMGRATENVNVNINELHEKTPAELLEMLNSLNG